LGGLFRRDSGDFRERGGEGAFSMMPKTKMPKIVKALTNFNTSGKMPRFASRTSPYRTGGKDVNGGIQTEKES
jgi:hypothetical protein